MALRPAKLSVSLFRHPCRKPLSPERGRIRGLASLRPALGLRPKPHFGITIEVFRQTETEHIRQICSVQFVEKVCFWNKLLIYYPYPPAPFPPERGWIRGLASLRPALGLRPKQGCFDCLPKVLHDAKPTEQAISDTPIFRKHKGLSTDWNTLSRVFQTFSTICYGLWKSARIFCTFSLFHGQNVLL